jgi:hypothetical protein
MKGTRGSGAAVCAVVAAALAAGVATPAASALDAPPSPTESELDTAALHAAASGSEAAFAIADATGRVRGWQVDRTFESASVVKAMLLVAYLNRPERRAAPLREADRRLLAPMIRRSANRPAQIVYRAVGDSGLRRLAARAGMERFRSSHVELGWEWGWGGSRITAADQARFFLRILDLIPPRHRAYVRRLLTTIVWHQSWGIPAVVAGRWTTLFKGGWGPSTADGVLVSQVARIEAPRGAVGLAILTERNPTYEHGHALIERIAELVLGPALPTGPAPPTGVTP